MTSRDADNRPASMNRKPYELSIKSGKDVAKDTSNNSKQGPSVAEREPVQQHDLVHHAKSYWAEAAASRMKPIEHTTARSSPALVNQAYAAIDAEIEAALATVSSMRSRYNTLSPISLLPEDILMLIFDFLSHSSPFYYSPARTSWVVVTYICRVWRQTALAHSHLWRKIDVRLPLDWIDLFLERAKTAPLAITVSHRLSPLTSNFKLTQDHLWHTASIHFHGGLDDIVHLVKLLEGGAPLLAVLELQIASIGFSGLGIDVTLPMAFIEHSPELHTLHVHGLPLPSWTALSWPNLRCLEVTVPLVGAISDLQSLLCCLESTSRLETLRLMGCIPSHAGNDKQAVRLPFLRTLGIGGVLEDCTALWDALEALAVEDFHLDVTNSRNGAYHIDDVMPILREYLNTAAAQGLPSYQTLIVKQTSALCVLSVTAWRSARLTDDIDDSFNYPENEPRLRFNLSHSSVHGSHRGLMDIENFYKTIGVDELRALSVSFSGGDAWSKKMWLAIFGRAQHIQAVRLFGVAAFAFSKALVPTITKHEDPPQAGPSTVRGKNSNRRRQGRSGGKRETKRVTVSVYEPLFLQSLGSVQFYEVSFDRAYEGKPFCKKLLIWLRQRLAAPMNKLTMLILRNCQMQNSHLTDLRQIKDLQIDWDRHENDLDDASDLFSVGDELYYAYDGVVYGEYLDGLTQAEAEWYSNYSFD